MSCREFTVSPKTPLRGVHRALLLREFPDGATENLWREFLTHTSCPAHYDAPEFFLEPYWKDRSPFAILLLCRDRAVGALTGFDEGKEIISGQCSRPQVCIAQDADLNLASLTLADALVSYFPDAKLLTVYAWGSSELLGFADHGFRKVTVEGSAVVDLRPGAQFILENLPQHRRRDIRKAIRNRIEITEATTTADLEAYWGVYSRWKHTKRKKIHHPRELAELAAIQQMRGNHRRFMAWYKGQAIAALGIRFYRGGLIECANNCSRDECLHLCPNDLLVWRAIEWGCENGFCTLSMGGAHPFVRKWSDTVIPVYRYRLDRTLLHSVELKDGASQRARRWMHRLPTSVQRAIKTILRPASWRVQTNLGVRGTGARNAGSAGKT